ncbi:Crp/Fnr family transcriptional regulator [Halomonas daqiaonensis]|uniref:cAMP-binding domain of CRP or a regulatory subunit of cAMP-dependent protein kinases n=1 Tax=Halomonas daqiaonensis TaxID=650850 RepID=A0A1H7FEX2_9GAMM|nr:Crp/Fnr family transcriptional regulator [Halomonas daqiaonensis]SEK24519.1 cAMP-binding domain of CRP or a regulatory subunit of cAMP-dependent protein kinases [Halomonas daqiaonensis]
MVLYSTYHYTGVIRDGEPLSCCRQIPTGNIDIHTPHHTASSIKEDGTSLFQRTMERHVDLSTSERELLAGFEQRTQSAAKNELLWRPRTRVGELFILQSGWACTVRCTAGGEQQVIELLLPGDIIGLREFTFMRHVTEASMITQGSIQPFPHENIVDIITASTPLAIALFAIIGRQETLLTERMLMTLHRSARSQVLHFMVETFFRLEKVQPVNLASFEFPVSQRLLGNILGLSPVHINRILKSLEQDGVLKKHRDHIDVYDTQQLIKEAEFDADYLSDELDGLKERLAQLQH